MPISDPYTDILPLLTFLLKSVKVLQTLNFSFLVLLVTLGVRSFLVV